MQFSIIVTGTSSHTSARRAKQVKEIVSQSMPIEEFAPMPSGAISPQGLDLLWGLAVWGFIANGTVITRELVLKRLSITEQDIQAYLTKWAEQGLLVQSNTNSSLFHITPRGRTYADTCFWLVTGGTRLVITVENSQQASHLATNFLLPQVRGLVVAAINPLGSIPFKLATVISATAWVLENGGQRVTARKLAQKLGLSPDVIALTIKWLINQGHLTRDIMGNCYRLTVRGDRTALNNLSRLTA